MGHKSIPIKTTGHDKCRITVCLAAKANGIKLPPFIVFKGKRRVHDLEAIEGVICVMSENGWMNEKLIHEWLRTTWGELAFGRRLIVWDSNKCRIQDSTKQLALRLNTDMAVIPGGCTSLIQAPDVSWNKPFKDRYRELYEEWMRGTEKGTHVVAT